MKKVMIRISVMLFVAMGITPQVNGQSFKAALFNEDYGTVRVIAQEDGESFHLIYQVPDENYVKVNIYNQEDRIIFTEAFRNKDSFRRPYNLSRLPEGVYRFEITGSLGTYTQDVTLHQP